MNSRVLADPAPMEQFELPFSVDMSDEALPPVPHRIPQEEYLPAVGPSLIGAEIALARADGDDYIVKTPAGEQRLQRDVDFGVIPGTKQPTLLKAGAEKVAMAYGLFQHYTIEHTEQDFGVEPFAFYLVKCELVKLAPNGKEYVFTTGYGSANTREKRNGRNDAFNAANACIKMAQKRALTSAALSISGLSSMFTQDMDNENFINENIAALSATNNPNAPITRKQMNLLYAKAGNLGLTAQQAKARMAEAGFASVKGITQKEYDKVLELFQTPAEKEAREAQRGEE